MSFDSRMLIPFLALACLACGTGRRLQVTTDDSQDSRVARPTNLWDVGELKAFTQLLVALGEPAAAWQQSLSPIAKSRRASADSPSARNSARRTDISMGEKTERSGGAVLLSGTDLSLSYTGERSVFDGVNINLARGCKLALIGANGAGKSSLMKVLGGIQKPDSGSVQKMGAISVAYVEQEPTLPAGSKAEEFFSAISTKPEAVDALLKYRAAEAALNEDMSDEAVERLTAASTEMDAAGAWDIETEMNRISQSLTVNHLLSRDAASLSGGERKRMALAAALLQKPDLLLLDEPTNHLDMQAIRWLERELRSSSDLSTLIVTHDRAFISGACEEVLELDRSDIFRHRGTYDDFLEAKKNRLENEERLQESRRDRFAQEKKWAERGAKARATKSKSRLEAFEEMKEKIDTADKRLEQAKGVVKIEHETGKGWKKNRGGQRLGSTTVMFEGVTLWAPSTPRKRVLEKFTYEFLRGDRIGISGPNGAGKSTMLKAMMGMLPVDEGEIGVGQTVAFGYFDQQGLNLPNMDVKVIDFVREACAEAGKDDVEAYSLLQKFLFTAEQQETRISLLSGGERRRLQLLRVLATQPNFLVLDEPTNDLDLRSIAVLEEFLLSYTGILAVVSHDRYFLDRVCNYHFILAGDGSGKVIEWPRTFSGYLDYYEAQQAADAKEAEKAKKEEAKKAPKMSYKDASKMYGKQEREVEKFTKKLEEVQKKVDGYDASKHSYEELGAWSKEAAKLNEQIMEAEEIMLEMMEIMDG